MKTNKEIITDLERAIAFLKTYDYNTGRLYAFSQLEDIIWDEYREKSMELFLKIQERERKAAKDLLQLNRLGLQDAMHWVSNFSEYSINGKPVKSKTLAKDIIFGDNIAHIIHIVRAYFPKGNSDFASESGKKLFKRFVEQLLKYKDKYVVGGKSRDWAERYGHADYIDLIIKQNDARNNREIQ